jgi:prepilin-type N-terminal cleavage/methylation domain-containing protein
MASLRPAIRTAFTLTELLIVIAIITLLAGLLYPALNMVKAQANEVKCESNMRNIAMALEVYRQDHTSNFPDSFLELETQYALPPKVLLCPLDPSHGTDPFLGRVPNGQFGWKDYSYLYYAATGSSIAFGEQIPANQPPALTSYDFEANGRDDANFCTQADIDFFYHNLPPNQVPTEGTVSWADCKLNEQANGNWNTQTNSYSLPFPTAAVPILRCYNHWDWLKTAKLLNATGNTSATAYPAQVVNINLDFGAMKTIPWWEVAINPGNTH